MHVCLSKICGSNDVISPIGPAATNFKVRNKYPLARNFRVSETKENGIENTRNLRGHESAKSIKKIYGPAIWDSYFKFCFDRNPYDKFLSFYFWRNANMKEKKKLAEFLEGIELKKLNSYDQYSIDSVVAVDKIYKYEEMDKALEDLSKRFRLEKPLVMPDVHFKSHTRNSKEHYSNVLSKEQIEFLSIVYAREIKLLGY